MKSMRIAAFIIAAAAGFDAFAQDATTSCIQGVASDGRLVAIADKVALDSAREPRSSALRVYASEEERAALALWRGLRRQCFDAGEQQRERTLDAQARGAVRSAFIFQQVLLSRLEKGELTYDEFNRRRAELGQSFELRI